RSLGSSAYGSTLCGPVFQKFMARALEGQGPVEFPVPPGGRFIRIDRATGQRLPDNATGPNVQVEYIKEGQETVVGGYGRTVDGGWRMGADVPLVSSGGGGGGQEVTIDGRTRVLPARPTLGTISGGGLY